MADQSEIPEPTAHPRLSWYQKYRHRGLKKAADGGGTHPDVILYSGEIEEIVKIDGYLWHLHDGQTVTARDIRDASAGKWLYRIYC